MPRQTRHVKGVIQPIVKAWIEVRAALWESQIRGEILFVLHHFETLEGGNWMRMLSGFLNLSTTTTTTESRNMAAILLIIGCQRHGALVCCVLLSYWTSMLWSIDTCQKEYPLTSIRWPYRGLKFRTRRGNIILYWPLSTCRLSNWIAGLCQVNLLKTGQDCSETGLKIKSNRIITFFFYRNVFCCSFWVYGDC